MSVEFQIIRGEEREAETAFSLFCFLSLTLPKKEIHNAAADTPTMRENDDPTLIEVWQETFDNMWKDILDEEDSDEEEERLRMENSGWFHRSGTPSEEVSDRLGEIFDDIFFALIPAEGETKKKSTESKLSTKSKEAQGEGLLEAFFRGPDLESRQPSATTQPSLSEKFKVARSQSQRSTPNILRSSSTRRKGRRGNTDTVRSSSARCSEGF